MEFIKYDELFEQSQVLFDQAKSLASNKDATAEYLQVNFLIEGATGELQKSLDEALEEYQRGFNGEGTGDPIGIIGAGDLCS